MKIEIDLRLGRRSKLGYCFWFKDGGYKATIYLEEIYFYANKIHKGGGPGLISSFYYWFWFVLFHEIIGHGIGHRFKIKGYSARKDFHFDKWLFPFMEMFAEIWRSSLTENDKTVNTLPLRELVILDI